MADNRTPVFFVVAAALLLAPLPPARAEAVSAKETGSSQTAADRIICAGGVITEIVYALGRADLIAGVDVTSKFPAAALKEKPNVGYVRALSSEGLLSLKPTRIIAIDSAGPPDVLKAVEAAGVTVQRVTETPTVDGIAQKIEAVAALIGEKDKGAKLAAETRGKFDEVAALRAKVPTHKKALFILSFQNGRAMVGGRGTAADGILALAGLDNAVSDMEGWKPIGDEAVVNAAPEILVSMVHGPQNVTVDSILATPAFAATPAGKSKSVLLFDGEYLLSFGPRTPQAAHDLLLAAYPALAKPAEATSSQ